MTSKMPFRHLVLTCEPGVLIPRPDRSAVDVALEGVDAATQTPTEYACLRLALERAAYRFIGHEMPTTRVYATDLSSGDCAGNSQQRCPGLQERVELIECDFGRRCARRAFTVLLSVCWCLIRPTFPHACLSRRYLLRSRFGSSWRLTEEMTAWTSIGDCSRPPTYAYLVVALR